MILTQATPTQSRLMAEHKARRARIAAASRPQQLAEQMADKAHAQERKAIAESFKTQFNELWKMIETESPPPVYADIPELPSISVKRIIAVVAHYYSISVMDLISARRTRGVVYPRQVAGYLAKTLTLRSYPEIGRCMGGRDHTTQMHAFRKINEALPVNAELRSEVAALVQIIERL